MTLTRLLSRFGLTMLPILLVVESGYTQSESFFSTGESVLFEVILAPGTSYCWKVTDSKGLKNGTETDKVIYLSPRCNHSVLIRWHTPGTYFLAVTGFNQQGCSNMKVFRVSVSNNHVPVAVDDYFTTSWLKNISVNLTINDFDAGNDLDPSSLRIVTKPEFGELTVEPSGLTTYVPHSKHKGSDRFFYRICDLCNQCDTAKVTIDLTDPILYIPQALSPNGDGINDRFVISGLVSYPNSSLTIFSREGLQVYHSEEYQNDWTGAGYGQKSSSGLLPSGTYYYVLHLGGTTRLIKGFIYIGK